MFYSPSFAKRLHNSPKISLVAVAAAAAFLAYCSVYAFRKPFTAAAFDGPLLWGIHYKIVLVTAQVAGYSLSKFIGIRVIAALGQQGRAKLLLGVVVLAELALLGFALTPFPWSVVWMFLNGLPLGMAWGLVFGYLEGRKVTEILAAVLCVNFIVSSGFSKTTGKWLMQVQEVPEHWMPFVAGLLFLPLLVFCIWVLEHLPGPTEEDKLARTERLPMDGKARKALFQQYAPGLFLLSGVYLILTVVRDVRDNFAVEIWSDLGFGAQPAILTTAELPVAIFTLMGVGALFWVKNNFRALGYIHLFSFTGAVLVAGATFLFEQHQLSPITWMILSGSGLFLPYILFNGVLFDRLLAAFREAGNVGFLMYIADSIGYLGSVGVLLWRNFGSGTLSWLAFFTRLCYIGAGAVLILSVLSWIYFKRKCAQKQDVPVSVVAS